jgi:hypothetical protein
MVRKYAAVVVLGSAAHTRIAAAMTSSGIMHTEFSGTPFGSITFGGPASEQEQSSKKTCLVTRQDVIQRHAAAEKDLSSIVLEIAVLSLGTIGPLIFLRARLVHLQISPFKLRIIERVLCAFCFLGSRHLYESETFSFDYFRVLDFSVC